MRATRHVTLNWVLTEDELWTLLNAVYEYKYQAIQHPNEAGSEYWHAAHLEDRVEELMQELYRP